MSNGNLGHPPKIVLDATRRDHVNLGPPQWIAVLDAASADLQREVPPSRFQDNEAGATRVKSRSVSDLIKILLDAEVRLHASNGEHGFTPDPINIPLRVLNAPA